MAQGNPLPGEKYLHFKKKLYQVIAVAKHSETMEPYVVYQALYGDFGVYARPLSMFVSEVDHVKYPQVSQKYRFERVDEPMPEAKQDPPVMEPPVTQQTKTIENTIEPDMTQAEVEPKLLEFLEADSFDQKYNILTP